MKIIDHAAKTWILAILLADVLFSAQGEFIPLAILTLPWLLAFGLPSLLLAMIGLWITNLLPIHRLLKFLVWMCLACLCLFANIRMITYDATLGINEEFLSAYLALVIVQVLRVRAFFRLMQSHRDLQHEIT